MDPSAPAMGGHRAISIIDIAAAAGVSRSTVSRALNDQAGVNPSVRSHVKDVAARMGYMKDFRAQALKTQKTHTVGMLVRAVQLSFYGEFVAAVQRSLERKGFRLAVVTQGVRQSETEALHFLMGQRPEAVVVASGRISEELLEGPAARIPIVLAGPCSDASTFGSVGYGTDAAAELARVVAERGHREVVTLSSSTSRTLDARSARMGAELRAQGVRVVEVPFGSGDRPEPDALRAALSTCTAVMTPGDPVAVAAWEQMETFGLAVPHDVSLTGFDGVGQLATPVLGLTTVRLPVREAAEQAVTQVVARLQDDSLGAWHSVLEGTVVLGRTLDAPRRRTTSPTRP
ncbi:MAG: LacI family DNA-binding transcriptional regulator [Propionibacteriaceae bacterium]|nr:LacI family DNA-binding transcriptional regulator [Propionibacteriaceae bacterium]